MVGKHLTQAVSAYNQGVGSFERRVLVTARKFQDLDGVTDGGNTESGIPELPLVDVQVRSMK